MVRGEIEIDQNGQDAADGSGGEADTPRDGGRQTRPTNTVATAAAATVVSGDAVAVAQQTQRAEDEDDAIIDTAQPTAAKQWYPSANQQRVLAAAQERGYLCTDAELSHLAGVAPHTIHRWSQDERFRRWWMDHARRTLARRLPRVHAQMIARACGDSRAGDPVAARLILEALDPDFRPRSEVSTRVSGQLDIASDVELRASLAAFVAAAPAPAPPALQVVAEEDAESAYDDGDCHKSLQEGAGI